MTGCNGDNFYCYVTGTLGLPSVLVMLLYAILATSPFWGFVVLMTVIWRRKAARRLSQADTAAAAIMAPDVLQPPTTAIIEVPKPLPVVTRPPSESRVVVKSEPEPEPEPDLIDDDDDDDIIFSDNEERRVAHLDLDEWAELIVGNRQEYPHVLIDAPTGAGKTTLARALAHKYLENGGQIYVINPNHIAGQWNDRVIAVDDDGEYSTIELAFQALLKEIGRRAAILKKEGPEALEWLQIVWDELPETMEECKSGALLLRKLARRGRAVKMGILAMVQLDTASETALKGRAGLKKGFTHIFLGLTARQRIKEYVFPRDERPAAFVRNNVTVIMDVSEVSSLAEQPLPDMFAEFELTVSEEENVTWTRQHVLVARLLAEGELSNYALTKKLFPRSQGTGNYAQTTKRIVAEVQAVLAQSKVMIET